MVDCSHCDPPIVTPRVTTSNVQSLPPPGGGETTITPPCSPPCDIMEIEEGELLDDTTDLDEIRCGERLACFINEELFCQ